MLMIWTMIISKLVLYYSFKVKGEYFSRGGHWALLRQMMNTFHGRWWALGIFSILVSEHLWVGPLHHCKEIDLCISEQYAPLYPHQCIILHCHGISDCIASALPSIANALAWWNCSMHQSTMLAHSVFSWQCLHGPLAVHCIVSMHQSSMAPLQCFQGQTCSPLQTGHRYL